MDRTNLWSTKKVIAGISNAFMLAPREEPAFNSARSRLTAMFGIADKHCMNLNGAGTKRFRN